MPGGRGATRTGTIGFDGRTGTGMSPLFEETDTSELSVIVTSSFGTASEKHKNYQSANKVHSKYATYSQKFYLILPKEEGYLP